MSLSVQTAFSRQQESALRETFQIAAHEAVRGALWIADGTGFAFTDRRFYWNVPTQLLQDSKRTDVQLPSNILQKNISQLGTDDILREGPGGTFLVLTSSIGDIRFTVGSLSPKDGALLADFFVSYVRNGDFSAPGAQGVPLWQHLQQLVREAGVPRQQLLSAVFDIAAGAMLTAALLFAVKPLLLVTVAPRWNGAAVRLLAQAGKLFFVLSPGGRGAGLSDIQEPLLTQLLNARNVVFLACMVLYVLCKSAALSFSPRRHVTLAVACVAAETACCLLIPALLPLFAVLTVAFYAAFQWSCGIRVRTVAVKAAYVLLCALVILYELHLFLYPGFASLMGAVLQALSL